MKISSDAFVILLAVLALATAACGGGEEEDAGMDTGATDTVASAPGEYHAMSVPNGGHITGRVMLAGEPPKLEDFTINADESVCAPASPNNRLSLGSGGGIASAVVFIEGIREGKPMPALPEDARTMDQRNCQYVPHMLAVPVGSHAIFTNGDDASHNVRVEEPGSGRVMMNQAQPVRGRRDSMMVQRAGPVSVGCDYHPWMNAYVFGVDNPYYAVTDSSGAFRLADVPPGSYTVKMWLNGFVASPRKDNQGRIIRYAYGEPYVLEQQVTVTAGGTAELAFQVSAR